MFNDIKKNKFKNLFSRFEKKIEQKVEKQIKIEKDHLRKQGTLTWKANERRNTIHSIDDMIN